MQGDGSHGCGASLEGRPKAEGLRSGLKEIKHHLVDRLIACHQFLIPGFISLNPRRPRSTGCPVRALLGL